MKLLQFESPVQLQTERLRLRQWRLRDHAVFAGMNADPEVMRYFPRALSRDESDAMADRIQSLITAKGWGLWAVERIEDERFVGFVGLHEPTHDFTFSPCVEIGWRLSRDTWGQGIATEAAKAAVDFAFQELELEKLMSFTPKANLRSMAVMERIGMHDTKQDFDHPALPQGHELERHALYCITNEQWQGSK
ncbi:MAG TPA: GNAT family N-acetyltransferase [Oceanospirillaceae bacterium]|nr:GNAT family N-acetyltransferase [Oceanospirillaceae bacterium]